MGFFSLLASIRKSQLVRSSPLAGSVSYLLESLFSRLFPKSSFSSFLPYFCLNVPYSLQARVYCLSILDMEEQTNLTEQEEVKDQQVSTYSTVTVVQSGKEQEDDDFDFQEDDDELRGLEHLRSPAFQDTASEPQEMHCSLVFCFRQGEEEREILLGLICLFVLFFFFLSLSLSFFLTCSSFFFFTRHEEKGFWHGSL